MKSTWKTLLRLFLVAVLAGGVFAGTGVTPVSAQVSLHTTYAEISVPPGESIRYTIDVNNDGDSAQTVSLDVVEAPDNWEWSLTSGGWEVRQIAVQPGESWDVSLEVDVPLQVERGTYRFVVSANNGEARLPILINVTEAGTYQSELTTDQPNMEGHADSSFNFSLELENRTAEEQLYALKATPPARGWQVVFESGGQRVSSVNVEPNDSQNISVEVTPPAEIEAGTYQIPVQASNNSTSAEVQLEVAITGTYALELSTPNDLLSYDIGAGGERTIQLEVRNTGTADITDVEMSANTPVNWEVSFDPKQVDSIPAGESTTVQATIKSDDKSLPGDYVTTVTATAPEVSDNSQLRITVKSSSLWGWIGVLIILAVIAGVYYLFRTYGRR